MSDEITVHVTKHGTRKFFIMYFDDPLTGKREQRSTKETDRAQADKAAGAWQHELRTGKYCSNRRLTWAQFRERYENEKLPTLSIKTQKAFATAANHFEALINPKYLSSISAAVLSRFQLELRKKPAGEAMKGKKAKPKEELKKMSETSIAAHLRHIKAALGWAVRQRMIAEAPRIDMPAKQKGKAMMRGRPITAEEFDRMLAAVDKVKPHSADDWKRYLNGLWLSGLRLEESAILSWDQEASFCIDLSGKHPRFRIYAEAQKGRRDELLPMTPDFAALILKTPTADRQGLVFKLGLTVGHIGRMVSTIGQKAGVVIDKTKDQYATAHDLRRAFGTRWAKRVTPVILQRLMRHASIETTMRYYVGIDADDIAADLWRYHSEQVGTSIGTRLCPKTALPRIGEACKIAVVASPTPWRAIQWHDYYSRMMNGN